MRPVEQTASNIRRLVMALGLTVSTLSLCGCVSSKETADAALNVDPAQEETATVEGKDAVIAAYRDQQVAAVGANAAANEGTIPATAAAAMPQQNEDAAPLTMQSTGVNAMSNSIFSSQQPSAAMPPPPGNGAPATGTPASNSLFNSAQPQPAPAVMPVEGASSTETKAAEQSASAEGTTLPTAVPVPADTAAARATAAQQQAAVAVPAGDSAKALSTASIAAAPRQPTGPGQNDTTEAPVTLAALFAAKRKGKADLGGERSATTSSRRSSASASAAPTQVAALGFTALPGVQTRSMYSYDDAEPSHDEDRGTVQMASLSGLARLAPNGLMLQTETVETGCFKPDLLQMLKVVETHYGRKLVVTSGLRDLRHNVSAGGRKHSLHTTCEAADIQVPGVSKWDLAAYLRTIPGRGGVGTYCHTESVHIDTGEERDWNWRCRRRKG